MNCRLIELFRAQEELMYGFLEIESRNGFRPPSAIPVNLDDPHDQLRLKELAWRVTEEIGETVLAMTNPKSADDTPIREEFSDVFHFLLELFIVAGLSPDRWPLRPPHDRLGAAFEEAVREMSTMSTKAMLNDRTLELVLGRVVWDLADAMNELKNRPWKQSARVTDRIAFYNKLQNAMGSFILACLLYGIATDELHSLYFRKHNINRKRQETGA